MKLMLKCKSVYVYVLSFRKFNYNNIYITTIFLFLCKKVNGYKTLLFDFICCTNHWHVHFGLLVTFYISWITLTKWSIIYAKQLFTDPRIDGFNYRMTPLSGYWCGDTAWSLRYSSSASSTSTCESSSSPQTGEWPHQLSAFTPDLSIHRGTRSMSPICRRYHVPHHTNQLCIQQ